jgi:ornithine decarboxylase
MVNPLSFTRSHFHAALKSLMKPRVNASVLSAPGNIRFETTSIHSENPINKSESPTHSLHLSQPNVYEKFSKAAETSTLNILDVVRSQVFNHEAAFYVADLSDIARKYQDWVSELPNIKPFYAVKCNDDPRIVKTLKELGTGFDCASQGEMSLALSLGVNPSDIIFAHPAKQLSHIHYAKQRGVKRMTFDGIDEALKLAQEYPDVEAVLRIYTDDSQSVCRLGSKFGCPLSHVKDVLLASKAANLNVVGISYHVGSGNTNPNAFGNAVFDAKKAFDIGKEVGYEFTLLDIGGGFPGSTLQVLHPEPVNQVIEIQDKKVPSFKVIAASIRAAMKECFPPSCGVTVIAEPGRFFVKSSHTLAVLVMAKKTSPGNRVDYYVNDGLYGSFNCILYDHVHCYPSAVLSPSSSSHASVGTTSINLHKQPVNVSGNFQSVRNMSYRSLPNSLGTTTTTFLDQSESDHQGKELQPGEENTSTIWGPTCDSMDRICTVPSHLLADINIGDWLLFENMGAYTIAGSSRFNGYPLSSKVYINPDGTVETMPEDKVYQF